MTLEDCAKLPIERMVSPHLVDRPETFRGILGDGRYVGLRMPVVFPVHPRKRQQLAEFGLVGAMDAAIVTDLPGYIDFLALTSHAALILTDSARLQEESTALGIPCLALRENTERPVTVTDGTNRVVGRRTADIVGGVDAALASASSPKRLPEMWDGHAAERIVAVLARFLSDHRCGA